MMIKSICTAGLTLLVISCFSQINEIELIPDGIVFPRMTTAQRTALSPSTGQCIFNTQVKALECYDGTSWLSLQRQDKIVDQDGDTKISLQEFGGGFPDQIDFQINASVPMKLEESAQGSTRLYLDDGQDNVLIGELAGNSIGSGQRNTYVGEDAGKVTIAGNDNVAVGNNAGNNIRNGEYNITIGSEAGYNINSGHDNITIGHLAGRNINGANGSVVIGSEAGMEAGGGSVLVGSNAGKENMGGSNTFIGNEAGTGTPLSNGNQNVAIGSRAGVSITGGSINTVVGAEAGASISSRDNNVAIGFSAGAGLKSGRDNVMIGANAGQVNEKLNNIFIGKSSGSRVTGSNNIFLGTDNAFYDDVSNQLFIGPDINDRLISGEFDNETVTIHGDLQIHPKGNPGNNSHLRMADSSGNMDEIIRRGGTNNDVVMGDVNDNGGDLHLRAAGNTHFSVLNDGSAKFWPMSNPPGTCNTTRRGQVYFDSDDNKLKACGQRFNLWGWHDMF